jgi:hypothetical protein
VSLVVLIENSHAAEYIHLFIIVQSTATWRVTRSPASARTSSWCRCPLLTSEHRHVSSLHDTGGSLAKLAADLACVNDSNKMTESPRSPFITEIRKRQRCLLRSASRKRAGSVQESAEHRESCAQRYRLRTRDPDPLRVTTGKIGSTQHWAPLAANRVSTKAINSHGYSHDHRYSIRFSMLQR